MQEFKAENPLGSYDRQSRIKKALSGIEAHGQTETDLTKLPYRQNYAYNAFGNLTERESTMWDYEGDWDFAYSMSNNRVSGVGYDNDGRQLGDSHSSGFQFDAAGRLTFTNRGGNYETAITHDGMGRETRRSQRTWEGEGEEADWSEWEASYFIQSSVLGRIVTEANATGDKKVSYVVAGGVEIARQQYDEEEDEAVVWKYTDASGMSTRTLGGPLTLGGYLSEELDVLGNNVGTLPNTSPPPRLENTLTPNEPGIFNSMSEGDCTVDGLFMPCSMALRAATSGSAVIDHIDPLFRQRLISQGSGGGGRWVEYYEADGGSVNLETNTVTITAGLLSMIYVPDGDDPKIVTGSGTENQRQALREAFREALDRLRNPRCAGLFTSFFDSIMSGDSDRLFPGDPETASLAVDLVSQINQRDPSEVLRNVEYRILPLRPPRVVNGRATVTGAQSNSRTSVFLNS